jgi:hypothetical protein
VLKESQRYFYAIKRDCYRDIDLDEGENTFLEQCDIGAAIQDKTLTEIADTYNQNDNTFSSGFWNGAAGYPVITFNRQLKYGTFPMAQILNRVLQLGEEAMGCPVEIEFAGNFSGEREGRPSFNLLQLRPFMEQEENLRKEINPSQEEMLVYSRAVSGNRVLDNIQDLVYVKPKSFDSTRTITMAEEIYQINKRLVREGRPYILIGPGRWGTHDRHLGIPVDWNAINGVRVIMEYDLADFKVDHSQGSHFFHNITAAGIPYFFIKHNSGVDFLDWEWLADLEVLEDSTFTRHVRSAAPFLVIVNGKKREGRVIKPGPAKKWLE